MQFLFVCSSHPIAELYGDSSPKAKAERTGTTKLSAKQQIEALGKRIVNKHDRRFVKGLIGVEGPPMRKSTLRSLVFLLKTLISGKETRCSGIRRFYCVQ
jgi:hypothetical protein